MLTTSKSPILKSPIGSQIRVVGETEKFESVKLESLKLDSFCSSWKESSEINKVQAKL